MISIDREKLDQLIDTFVAGVDCTEIECPAEEECRMNLKECPEMIREYLGIKEGDK